MVLVQKWPFFQLFFLANIGQEKFFYDVLERKNAFQGYKNKNIKKSKNSHFSKVVNPRFWSKNGQFSDFFLGNIRHENVFYDILERINAFLGCKNKKIKKSKNWYVSKGVNRWFWYKNGHFSKFFFRKNRPGKFLLRYSSKKFDSLGYKNKKIKQSKNWHFSKGVNHGPGLKITILPTFF